MPHRSDLSRALDRFALGRRQSRAQLAADAGLHPSVLDKAATGQRTLTTQALTQLVHALPEHREEMQELVWRYICQDVPVQDVDRGLLPWSDEPSHLVPHPVSRELRRYVREFPQRLLAGRGLLITASAPSSLTAALTVLSAHFEHGGVAVVRRSATDRVHPSEQAGIERARLLILERVDFARESGRALLADRLQRALPVAVTTLESDLAPTLGSEIATLLQKRCTRVSFPDASHA